MIFSILAFIALIISICIKDRRKSLHIQSINCLFEMIYCFIINALTGAIVSIINLIRTLLFVYKDKFNKNIYLLMLIIFESVIVINCIYTWEGYISLFPTIGSMIRTYCLWQTNMKLVRISGISTGILYGLYYVLHGSWFMVLGDVVLLVISLISIYKNDINKERSLKYNKISEV